jgi:hypothetical protein
MNKSSPNYWKKWPKNTKISTSKLNLKAKNIHIKQLKILTTNDGLKLLVWVKIGHVKSSLNGEISPNLVTLVPSLLPLPPMLD